MEVNIEFNGFLEKLLMPGGAELVHQQIIEGLAKSAEKKIKQKFEQSVQLAYMTGQRADNEAVKAILRSFKVVVAGLQPVKIEVKFEDDYRHWYGGNDMPKDIEEAINKVIDEALDEWVMLGEHDRAVDEIMEKF